MAQTKGKQETAPSLGADAEGNDGKPDCGLIMPISATANHDEKHWAAVQTLLHRGIRQAGLVPSNVWEGVNDRISKRIVSNIFRQDIVVADISDLNPNVMLELGLRLASKKPTVVVFEKGGKIPFDISDVGAIPYPRDLNILEMESFFEEFSDLLKTRLAAFKNGSYEPYLGDVVVEVLEPQTKEISVGEAVLERINEIATRIARLEKSQGVGSLWTPRDRAVAKAASRAALPIHLSITAPAFSQIEVEGALDEIASYYQMTRRGDDLLYDVTVKPGMNSTATDSVMNTIRALGGSVTDMYYG